MTKYYCPCCDKTFDEEDMKIIYGRETDRGFSGDELVCPDCGEFEDLEEK